MSDTQAASSLSAYVTSFQDREKFLASLTSDEIPLSRHLRETVWLILLTAAYGGIMGCYGGAMHALASAVKLPILFLLSILICFPPFFMLQQILGSKIGIRPMFGIILAGFAMMALILASFSPIIIFFMITGDNYSFIKLLHVAVLGLAGLIGMKTILDALKYACEKRNVYPKIGVTVFRCWVLILAFVGMQLGWNLRPFVGSPDLQFEWVRQRQSNFYLAVGKSFISLFNDSVDQVTEEGTSQRTSVSGTATLKSPAITNKSMPENPDSDVEFLKKQFKVNKQFEEPIKGEASDVNVDGANVDGQ